MDDPGLVRGGESAGYLDREIKDLVHRDAAAREALAQRFTRDQLTRDVMRRDPHPIRNRHDVRMIERHDRLRFLFESPESLRVAVKCCRQEFQSGFSAGGDVRREINFTHPARANSLDELIVANGLAGEWINLLRIENLRRQFRDRILNQISYPLMRGEQGLDLGAQ